MSAPDYMFFYPIVGSDKTGTLSKNFNQLTWNAPVEQV
jgi:hypothetical protein